MKLMTVLAVLMCMLAGCATSTLSEEKKELSHAYYSLGNAYLRLGSNQEAVRAYQRALEVNPSLRDASFNLAHALTRMERHEDALKQLDLLALQDPKNTRVLSRRAWSLMRADRSAEALDVYRMITDIDPGDTDARKARMLLLIDAGKFKEARDEAMLLLDFLGLELELLLSLYEIDRQLDEHDQLLWIEEAYRKHPKDRRVFEPLIASYITFQRYDDMLTVIEQLEKETAAEVLKLYADDPQHAQQLRIMLPDELADLIFDDRSAEESQEPEQK